MEKPTSQSDPRVDIDLENFFPFVATTLTRIFHALMEKEFKQLGINIAEWRILVCLSRNDSCTLNQVVRFTTLPQPSLSRAINRMEKKRLLTNAKLSGDGRFLNIRITGHGLKTLVQANELAQFAVEKNFSKLKRDEREGLMAAMKHLVRILEPAKAD